MATVAWSPVYNIAGTLTGRRSPVLKISDNRVVCFYVKAPQVGYGCIADVNPDTGNFTLYAESAFWNNLTGISFCLWACLLDSSTILVVFKNALDGDKLYGRVGVITGTNIAWGPQLKIFDWDNGWPHCEKLDSTRAVVTAMRDDPPANEGKGEVCIVEITGNIISAVGASQQYQTDRATPWQLYPWLTILNDSEFVISFRDLIGLNSELHVYYATVAGNVITLISFSAWDTDTVGESRGVKLTNNTYCIMWHNSTNTEGRICVGTIPTNPGAYVVFNTNAVNHLAIVELIDGRFVLGYSVGGASYSRIVNISGGIITLDAQAGGPRRTYSLCEAGRGDIVALLDPGVIALCYGAVIVPPLVTTDEAVVGNRIILNGTLDDDGNEACNCGFEWGESPSSLPNLITMAGYYNDGDAFLQYINGLAAGTYYYRAWASNSAGTTYGAIKSFIVLISASASISLLPVTNIGEHAATLNGHIDNSIGRYGRVRFEYGLTTKYGMQTAWQDGFITGDSFAANLTRLTEATLYHFRAQLQINPLVVSSDGCFSTLAPVGPITWITDDLMQLVSGRV